MSYLKQHQKEAEEKGMILIPHHEMDIAQHIRECKTLGDATEYLYGVFINIKLGIEAGRNAAIESAMILKKANENE